MADTVQRYQRLPGTGYRRLVPGWALVLLFFVIGIFVLLLRGRRVQLWRGEDHLLVVDWDGYREYYKRINYRDVQSVVICRTAEGWIASVLLGALTVVFAVLGIAVGDGVGMTILLVLAGLFALFLAVNLLQGATCTCQLRTAVQTEQLRSLTRVPTALKALAQLRPLIIAAQGELPAADSAQTLPAPLADTNQALGALANEPGAPPPIVS